MNKNKIIKILDELKNEYPEAGCALVHKDVFELIVCVVLSAQTTDVSVNKISGALFEAYPDAEALSKAPQSHVEDLIRQIGMYRTKSKNIINLAIALCEKYDGQVPDDYDRLIELPGVGRKTANVVLAEGFGQQRIAVDTHVFRVAHRIGLANVGGEGATAKKAGSAQVLATELELMKVLPEDRWSEAHHSLIWHGRQCCTARTPKCETCVLEELCEKRI